MPAIRDLVRYLLLYVTMVSNVSFSFPDIYTDAALRRLVPSLPRILRFSPNFICNRLLTRVWFLPLD